MKIFCHFDAMIPNRQGDLERVAIVFTAQPQFTPKVSAEELKLLFADAFVPRRTIFIGLEDNQDCIAKLLSSDDLKHINLPFEPTEAEVIYFSADGRLLDNRNNNAPLDAGEARLICRQGMTSIFCSRGGLMQSGNSYHYVKPSGGHSKCFLRPGNAMQIGPEVAFIACWLLSKINKFTSIIYADTASITQVAYSLSSLARRLGIIFFEPPIQSFSSYMGIDQAEAFAPEHDAFVLISASTSGSLRKRIIRAGAAPDNVVTLFSMMDDSDCLCNLSLDVTKNPGGLNSFRTYSRSQCPDCAAGAMAITIAGDSFLPETPEPRLKLLKRTEKPKWLAKVLPSMEGNKLVSCFKPHDEGQNSPFHVDLRKLCDASCSNKDFDLSLSRVLPVGIDAIIHLPDAGSKELAKKAHTEFSRFPESEPRVLVADSTLGTELQKLSKEKQRKISVTVIASCIKGGFTLLDVSRSLRNSASQISYFIGLAMQPNQQSWDEFRSNLELRNDEKGKNPIEIVWNAQMPRTRVGDTSSWDIELRWLEENQDHFDGNLHLNQRLSLLRNSTGERTDGLIDNTLLPSPTGKALKLAPNFAFHKSDNFSQADVFLIITSILHSLRESGHHDGLRQSLNGPVLLSPTNFDRYNDSVLQAVLLRAATSSELAYTTHPSSSKMMADQIIRMIVNYLSTDSESLPEFLLSLSCRRMTLAPTDCENVFKHFELHLEHVEYLSAFGPSLYSLLE